MNRSVVNHVIRLLVSPYRLVAATIYKTFAKSTKDSWLKFLRRFRLLLKCNFCYQHGKNFKVHIFWEGKKIWKNLKILWFPNVFLVYSILPKNKRKHSTWGTIVVKSNFVFHFLGDLKISKRHFKINWTLRISNKIQRFPKI